MCVGTKNLVSCAAVVVIMVVVEDGMMVVLEDRVITLGLKAEETETVSENIGASWFSCLSSSGSLI